MILKMLDISTAHITSETADWINELHSESICCPIIFYPKGSYGWIISVYEEDSLNEQLNEIPADLVTVVDYARKQDCQWIMLDGDGNDVPELPVYNW